MVKGKGRKCYCSKNWQIRNNSANVAAIVNPKMCTCGHKGTKKHFEGNNCYCHEKNIPPQIFPRPKQCICSDDDDDSEDHIAMNLRRKMKFHPKYRTTPSADRDLQETGTRSFLKSKSRRPAEANPGDLEESGSRSPLKFKSRRPAEANLEEEESGTKTHQEFNRRLKLKTRKSISGKFVADADIEFKNGGKLSKIQHFDKTVQRNFEKAKSSNETTEEQFLTTEDLGSHGDRRRSYFEETFAGEESEEHDAHDNGRRRRRRTRDPRNGTSQDLHHSDVPRQNYEKFETERISRESSPMYLPDSKDKQLVDFRNDHYFETHSTEDLMKTVPEHVCVHRFTLDDRFLPMPLNADPYEASRCIICGKPMEDPVVNKIDERSKGRNIFPKFYKYGLAPKKIYMGGGDNVRIEMNFDDRKDNFIYKPAERPEYFNTYALRYQRGVK